MRSAPLGGSRTNRKIVDSGEILTFSLDFLLGDPFCIVAAVKPVPQDRLEANPIRHYALNTRRLGDFGLQVPNCEFSSVPHAPC